MPFEREQREPLAPPDWVGHQHTTKQLRHWREQRKQAMLELLSEARASSDAAVRATASEIGVIDRFIAQLTGGDLKEEQ